MKPLGFYKAKGFLFYLKYILFYQLSLVLLSTEDDMLSVFSILI